MLTHIHFHLRSKKKSPRMLSKKSVSLKEGRRKRGKIFIIFLIWLTVLMFFLLLSVSFNIFCVQCAFTIFPSSHSWSIIVCIADFFFYPCCSALLVWLYVRWKCVHCTMYFDSRMKMSFYTIFVVVLSFSLTEITTFVRNNLYSY